jgi:SAM-dependent methyltransferase
MEAVESRISHKVVKADSLLTRAATARRKMISSYLEKVKPKVLEIGAFDNATFHSELGDDVHYLDFFSADELKEMHNGNPRRRLQHTVTVDYVVKSKHFAVEIDQKFDLIVANHVIEHILDVIFWFKQLESLLTKDGTIFLSVPDRRFTFDYFRNVSSATQMIRAHEEKLEMPDYWQLLDHFY